MTDVCLNLVMCSSQSSGPSSIRAKFTCRSHSCIRLRALAMSYGGCGLAGASTTSIISWSLQKKKIHCICIVIYYNGFCIQNVKYLKNFASYTLNSMRLRVFSTTKYCTEVFMRRNGKYAGHTIFLTNTKISSKINISYVPVTSS